MTKLTIQLIYTNGKYGQGKSTNMYFTGILGAIQHKEVIDKERQKFVQNPLDLIHAKGLLTKRILILSKNDIKERLVF